MQDELPKEKEAVMRNQKFMEGLEEEDVAGEEIPELEAQGQQEGINRERWDEENVRRIENQISSSAKK